MAREHRRSEKLLALKNPSELKGFVSDLEIDPTRAYNLSKEAIIAYTKGLTKALVARDMRANSVSPAPVATAILGDFMSSLGDRAVHALALPGWAASALEDAQVIVFMASEESHWIKGHNILVDGDVSAMITADALDLHFDE